MAHRAPSPSSAPSADRSIPFWFSPGWIALFFLALTLLFFWSYLSPTSQRVLSRLLDLSSQFIWWRQFAFEELAKGHLALWNPHLFCGTPFFGGFQSAILYPPNWLFMIFPMAFAMNFNMALHVFLAGWFTYLWARKRNAHPASALLAAFMFMFSGAFFLRILAGHLSNLCTMTWIPLIFLAVDGYRQDLQKRWILLGAFAVAMQVYSGHVQYVYYAALVSAAYVLLALPRMNRKISFLGGFSLMYGLGALLASVQLLAGWDAAAESIRGKGLSIEILSMLDMNPERLCHLLMPNFFGNWNQYWGGGIYHEGHPYVSVTGFVLALYALKTSSHPDKKIFAGIALFLTLLMMGTRTPLFYIFCKFFPLFDSFRGVSKLNILVTLCLAALAAMGLDSIMRSTDGLKGLVKGTAWSGAVFGLVSFIFFLAPRVGGARLFKQFLPHADEMALSLLLGGLFLAGISLLAFLSQKRKEIRWGFLILAFVELWIFAKSNLTTFDLAALKERISPIQKTYDREPGDYRVWVEKGNYTLGTSGLDVWGEDALIPLRYALFATTAENVDFDSEILKSYFFRNLSPALGLLRLRYVFHDGENGLVVERSGLKEAPRVFLTDRWEVFGLRDVINKADDSTFDIANRVLLESSPGFPSGKGPVQGQVTVKDLSSDQIEIKASLSKPALLVMTDNYSRSWKVFPLGVSSQTQYRIMPVFGFQRGVPLEAGDHHFLMEYRPTAYVVGKWISIFAWVLFAGVCVWIRPRFSPSSR